MTEDLMYYWDRAVSASWKFAILGIFFLLVSLIFKKRKALHPDKDTKSEFRLNIVYFFIDFIAFAPLLVLWISVVNGFARDVGLALFTEKFMTWPVWLVMLLALFASDFVGYWRHRLLHTTALWPVHAIHHSDTRLSWLGLARFHPINRFITDTFNFFVLSIIGFPGFIIFFNSLVRNYYGHFIHADIPLTYGPLRYVFVSPVMHRWHHLKEVEGAGSNFTTLFAFIDVVFGTFYVPKKEVGPLGVQEENFPTGWFGQFLHPFRVWGRAILAATKTTSAPPSKIE